jgi:hypothetical protein
MNPVSRLSGPNARRNSTRFSASIAASPAARTTTSVSATGKLTVAGDSTSTSVAATSTAAFVANTLHSSGIGASVRAD